MSKIRGKRYPGIILELKWKEKLKEDALNKLGEDALAQTDNLRYDLEMKEDGITNILKFGMVYVDALSVDYQVLFLQQFYIMKCIFMV